MTEIKGIRILIADDFKFLRDVIRQYLQQADDMEVIDEAPDLDDALERALTLRPDVIIMNDYLPPVDSAHAAGLFRAKGIQAAILSISMDVEADLIQRSLQHGVNGYMHKDEIDTLLVHGIRTIYQGNQYLSPKAQAAYESLQE